MTTHKTATWMPGLRARRDLLAAEKDLTWRSDQVPQLRQQLPWVRVDKVYIFDGPDGQDARLRWPDMSKAHTSGAQIG